MKIATKTGIVSMAINQHWTRDFKYFKECNILFWSLTGKAVKLKLRQLVALG